MELARGSPRRKRTAAASHSRLASDDLRREQRLTCDGRRSAALSQEALRSYGKGRGTSAVTYQRVLLPFLRQFLPGMIGERGRGPASPGVERAASGDYTRNDDVQRAINAMRAVQPSLLVAFGLSLLTFVGGAVAMVWIKTEPIHYKRTGHPNNHIALILSAVFLALVVVMAIVNIWIERLFHVRNFHDANLSGIPLSMREPLNRAARV